MYQDFEAAASEFSKSTKDLTSVRAAKIDITDYSLTEDDICAVYNVFANDNPQFYWLGKSIEFEVENSRYYMYLCVYEDYMKASVRSECDKLIEEQVAVYQSYVRAGSDNYAAAYELHNEIIHAIDYKYLADGVTPSTEASAHNIIGVFNGEGAVCEGYAKAYQLLLNSVGVENILVVGIASEGGATEHHAWNYVLMDDGKYYAVDTTWDDIGGTNDGETMPLSWFYSKYAGYRIRDTYFLCGKSFLDTHTAQTPADVGFSFQYDIPQLAESRYEQTNVEGMAVGNTINMQNENGFNFKVKKNTNVLKEVSISYCNDNFFTDGVVTIPSKITYEDIEYEVIGIESLVFGEEYRIKKIVVSEGVKYIAMDAFAAQISGDDYKHSMKELYLPATLEHICGEIYMKGLEKIYISDDNPYYEVIDNATLYTEDLKTLVLHAPASDITELTLPDDVERIEISAFNYSNKLEYIHFNENLKRISDNSIMYCEALKEIVIPSGVEYVGQNAISSCNKLEKATVLGNTYIRQFVFINCPSLTYIDISEDNVYCYDVDGVVYSDYAATNGLYLKTYPAGRKEGTYKLIDECKAIMWDAFEGTQYLKNVIIGNDVETLEYIQFLDTSIETITFNEDNPYYKFENGALYNLDKTELIIHLAASKDSDFTVPDTVKKIRDYAFYQNDNLVNVTMSDSVESMGSYAFYNCDNLETVRLSDNIKFPRGDVWYNVVRDVFKDCAKLEEINIPANTEVIPEDFLFGCSSLKSIVIPANVKYMESEFSNCSSLKYVFVESTELELIGCSYFAPRGMTRVIVNPDCNAYTNISEISSGNLYEKDRVILDEGILYYDNEDGTVSVIGVWVDELSDVTVKDTIEGKALKDVIYGSFNDETKVESIKLPASLKSFDEIGHDNEFMNCTNLKSIDIGGLLSIDMNEFYNCNSLEEIIVPDENTRYMSENGVLYTKNKAQLIKYPAAKAGSTYVVPDEVIYIEYNAFDKCSKLEHIVLNDNITEITSNHINNCKNLKSITIPETVTRIFNIGYYMNDEYENVKIDNLIIKGVRGSAAQEYAEANGFIFESIGEDVSDNGGYGDANGDGRLNVLDAVMMKQYIAGFNGLSINTEFCDVNVDSKINVVDVIMILRYIAGYDIELGKK